MSLRNWVYWMVLKAQALTLLVLCAIEDGDAERVRPLVRALVRTRLQIVARVAAERQSLRSKLLREVLGDEI